MIGPDAPSYSWTAASYSTLALAGRMPPTDAFRTAQGLVSRAIEIDDALPEADPLSLIVNTGVGEVQLYRKDYLQAADAFRHALELDQWFAGARFALGLSYLMSGRHADGLAEIETAVSHAGGEQRASPDLAYALGVSGNRAGAKKIRDTLVAQADSGFIDPYGIALANLGLDECDEACRWLEQAVDARSPKLVYLGVNPVFEPLKSLRRFAKLLQRIGLR